jgi:hypothetical protein
MREILFRGKRTDNGEWIEGYYIKGSTRHCIVMSLANYPRYDVIPETLGQYTGLTDKNGKRIFEGDIVKATGTNDHIGYVTFECGKFITRCTCHPKSVCDIHPPIEEVIGNIHDNPKLLKESEGGE